MDKVLAKQILTEFAEAAATHNVTEYYIDIVVSLIDKLPANLCFDVLSKVESDTKYIKQLTT